ncbi:hypothetical protein [Sphingobium chlorophenolicum]|uniref:hypothetical protein n=1 Tax=Sphingobium chlorophenolicum TaxID=46429 RepID=UPI0020B7878A|nr:hypothetical protein [Sphingobium chlorophenolicum]
MTSALARANKRTKGRRHIRHIGAISALEATSSGHIVIFDGPLCLVTREGARRLLEAVANGQLSFDVANYVADCIVMNDDFDFADEAVRDAIYFVEDDSGRFVAGEDDWRPTREETLAALAMLD